MAEINLERTVHVGGKVFFKGKAFVTDAEKQMIDAEIERLNEIDAQAAEDSEEAEEKPKKSKTKTDK
jgi:hypothetical protein